MTTHIDSKTTSTGSSAATTRGTTEPLNGLASNCTTCRETWPSRFGAGAATVRIVSKRDE